MNHLTGVVACDISTHAPRTGSDRLTAPSRPARLYFNPRSPHGERRRGIERRFFGRVDFNPRSPHGERRRVTASLSSSRNFNPRSPHGERPERPGLPVALRHFNPRSPHGERRWPARRMLPRWISTHAPRTGSDEVGGEDVTVHDNFNPRSPHGERRGVTGALRSV